MHIVEVSVENYKRVTLARIKLDPDRPGVVALMGPNESGKSSTLDALEALIAGRKAPKVSKPSTTTSQPATRASTLAEVSDTGKARASMPGESRRAVSAADSAFGAEIDHVIGGFDHVEMVLDHDHGMTGVGEPAQRVEESLHVREM